MLKYVMTGLLFLCTCGMAQADATRELPDLQSAQVMDQFNQDGDLIAPERAISTQRKHEILFWMGGALLLLIGVAVSFGVAMGVFGKDVFVWHVLSAGLATTLAIAHAVVAFVWFYPSA